MKIAFYGDSLTVGIPGSSYLNYLARDFPAQDFVNCGRFNDTVESLRRRIIRRRLLGKMGISFVWIGVNDVLTSRSRLFSRLRRDAAHDANHFRENYRGLLETLSPCASWVFSVPPVLIGEDVDGPFNQSLAEIAIVIEGVSAEFDNVRFVNLRDQFTNVLRSRIALQPVAQSAFQSVLDALRLRTAAQIEQAARRRGFYLTLDGVHLNEAGARLAANTFANVIRDYMLKS